MARTPHGTERRRPSTPVLIAIGVALIIVLAAIFIGTAAATDRPDFCPSCHEMKPYFDAWAKGPHHEVWCIDCHVGAGMPARLSHKFVALGEVRSHVVGDTSFPRPRPADVPDRRCLGCHPDPGPKQSPAGFSHSEHRARAACADCHSHVGHRVSDAALAAAGVLDTTTAAARASIAMPSGRVAAPGAGRADLPGHVPVACTRCHDLAATGCPSCHAAPAKNHPSPSDCSTCHKPGRAWVFVHTSRTDCTACHKPPKNHFGQNCGSCHRPGTDFKAATFNHPRRVGEHDYRRIPCNKCHPAGPPKVSCTCHGGGIFRGD